MKFRTMRWTMAVMLLSATLLGTGCSIIGIEHDEESVKRLKLFVVRDPKPSKTPLSIYDGDLPEKNAGLIELVSWIE